MQEIVPKACEFISTSEYTHSIIIFNKAFLKVLHEITSVAVLPLLLHVQALNCQGIMKYFYLVTF